MSEVNQEQHPPQGGQEQQVTIHVNNKAVRLEAHRVTGLQIKQAAIEQGVRIELDFVLLEVLEHNRTKPVRDDEVVEVTNHSKFDAIPNDDHSGENRG